MPDPNTLPRRPLGTTGLLVTPLCVGCAPLGSISPRTFGYVVPEERAVATVRAIFDGPVSFADTAASYGDGESERRIGLVIRERGGLPAGFVLASKADRDMRTGDFSGGQMRRSVERSLRLLGLGRLQLCYLHDAEHTTYESVMSSDGPLEILAKLKAEGLIEHLGVAGGPIDQEIRYVETGAFEVVITHNRYNLLNRDAMPLLEVAAKRGVAVVNAAPYGSGILARGPDDSPRFMYRAASPEIVARTRQIQAVCERYGVPLAAAALQFSLREPRIASTIVGMSRPERIAETVALAQYPIPEALWAELAPLLPEPASLPDRRP
jgi:D-threo-aldose 1-dehydrogenase